MTDNKITDPFSEFPNSFDEMVRMGWHADEWLSLKHWYAVYAFCTGRLAVMSKMRAPKTTQQEMDRDAEGAAMRLARQGAVQMARKIKAEVDARNIPVFKEEKSER